MIASDTSRVTLTFNKKKNKKKNTEKDTNNIKIEANFFGSLIFRTFDIYY
jgi:hypothetical protein